MSESTSRSATRVGVVVLTVLTAVVAFTAIRIEWFNLQVGGFLPRPQPPAIEGNNVKWRTTSPDIAEQTYRRGLAHERGIEITDESIASLELSDQERENIQELRRQTALSSAFQSFVASMGLLQYLLIPVGVICGIILWKTRVNRIRPLVAMCLIIHLITGGLMVYREYYPSLGH